MNRSDVTPALRPEQLALSFTPKRQNARPFAGLLLGVLLSFASAQTFAATFIVDNAGSQDDGDALAPGNDDNVCDIDPTTAGAHCTLRAAIQEANDTPEIDTITFASGITSITLTVGLPTITTPMIINGLNASAIGQRVDLNGANTISAFNFNAGAQGSTLKNFVIRNFNDDGIALTGHGYTIDNNYIGVMPSGLTASKNTGDGINITGVAGPPANIPTLGLPSNLTNIATITADLILAFSSIPPNYITTNVISGNDGDGIEIFSENAAVNIVANNKIGTNGLGLLAIPNGTGAGDGHGVRVTSFAYANIIGPGNVISGNNSDPNSQGVALISGAVRYPNFVSGNIIGPSSAIVTGLGNSVDGIFVDTRPQTSAAPNNPTNYAAFIGPGNIIGYNGDSAAVPGADVVNGADSGIEITGNSARVRVLGNFIGVGEDPVNNGTFVNIGNNGDGINISRGDVEIGGFIFPEANIISSNKRHGIAVRGSGTDTVKITGNVIGRDPLNLVNQSNDQDGIRIFDSSSIQIGGNGVGEGNVIAGNSRHGIKLGSNSSGSSNLIARNSIFGNGDLGIDLDRIVNDPDPIPDPLGVDPNALYANAGQNQAQICDGMNVPACAKPSYVVASGATNFNWRLSSALSTDYVFEVFASDQPNASGSGEGQRYLGTFNATTNGAGDALGNIALTPSPAFDTRGKYLTLTVRAVNVIDPPGPLATGPANNSSEFSNAVKVPVPGSLQFSSLVYSAGEAAGMATITVTRTGGSDDLVGLTYATSDGSATQPGDYTASTNTLSWNDGDSANKTFNVPIINDNADEVDETVILNLSNPTGGATLGLLNAATLTILDDDAAPTLAISDLSLAEGDAGTTAFTFTVSLSAASGKTVTVSAASADGTATLANMDYVQLIPTLITLNPGETSKPVTVNVNGDLTAEGNETFFVNLTVPSNASFGDAQGKGTITNDDAAAAAPTLSALPAAVTLTAGVGTAAVTVATAGVALANVALACTIPAGAASFSISGGANRSIDAPATLGANAPAIALSCTPQAAIATATLSCTQTATPAGAALPALTSMITCPALAAVGPTLTYAPMPNPALTTVTFPAGAAGATTSTISVTPAGSTGGGSTSVTACAISGAAGGGTFSAVSTTPANGIYVTAAGSVDLGCTRAATAGTATLTCAETAGVGAPVSRVWGLTCPAATVAAVAPTLSALPAAVTLTAGTGTATVTVATAGVATASVALTCTIPAGAASFAISGGANRSIDAPAGLGANAPAIALSCTPQAVMTTSTLSCTQTATPAGAALPALTSVITCPALAAVAPTLTYAPAPNPAPTTVTFPAGAAGAATSTISVTPAGSTGGGSTSVTVCAISGVAGGASFSAVTTTPANGIYVTAAGSVDLGCTRAATAGTATLTCTETAGAGAPASRVWGLTCPAATVAAVAPTLSALPAATTLTGGTGTATVTVQTAGVATANVALACTIPAGAPAFAISVGANRSIDAPAALGANAPAIGMRCIPQAAIATATLSCAQTATPAGAALPALTSTVTCPASAATVITANTAPGTVTLPGYIAPGATNSSAMLSFGISGGNGAMTCTISGNGYSVTPASPVQLTVAGPNVVTVDYTGVAVGTFAGGLTCTAIAPATGGPFIYTLSTTVAAPVAINTVQIPTLSNIGLMFLIAGFLGLGVVLIQRRQD